MNKKVINFFRENAVFRKEEFQEYCNSIGILKTVNINRLLSYYQKKNVIENIRRHLYISNESHHQPSPILIASKLHKDAVLAYHTALDFYGKSYSVYYTFYVLTSTPSKEFKWRNFRFQSIRFPTKLKEKQLFVEEKFYADQKVKVTSLERTLVDCLDKISVSGGWEEIIRSLEHINYIKVNNVVDYALNLCSKTTIAKVGYFLDINKERFFVEAKDLERLKQNKPKNIKNITKNQKGKLIKEWNLFLPLEVVTKSWEEPYLTLEDIPL